MVLKFICFHVVMLLQPTNNCIACSDKATLMQDLIAKMFKVLELLKNVPAQLTFYVDRNQLISKVNKYTM